MYLECRICNRVTEHSRRDEHSSSHHFASGVVNNRVYYICPHCNTGKSGTEITTNIGGKIESTFESKLG